MAQASLSRRRFLYLSGALAAGAPTLAAGAQETLAAHLDADKVTLTFGEATWGNSLTSTIKKTIIPGFQKLHPNVEVKMLTVSDNAAFTSQMLSRIAAGNPIEVLSTWTGPVSLAAQGLLEPLDHYMALSRSAQTSNWPVQELNDCKWGGKTYALPITASSFGFWYNVDWFAKEGIPTSREKFPKTWDELRKLSKQLTSWKGDQLITVGYVPMRLTQDFDIGPTMYIWSAVNGGQLYDPVKRAYTINSDQNVAMMEYMLSWLNEQYRGDMVAVDRSGNWALSGDAQNRPSAFKTGRLAMAVDGSWMLDGMNRTGGLKFDRYNVAPFPVGPLGSRTYGGSWPVWLAIPKGARNKEAAFAFMDYISSVGMVPWANATPDLPANKTIPYIIPATVVKDRGRAFATDMIRFFHHQADTAAPMWSSPVEDFCETQFTRAVDRIMHKLETPKAALAEAQQACQNRLKQVLSRGGA